MNGSSHWIEPPPHRHGIGCFIKGCLILVVFVILLGLAFVAGYYFAQKRDYFSTHHEQLPMSSATIEEEQAVRGRWDSFSKAAAGHEAARIELNADDLNALISSDQKLRGNMHVTIEGSTAHLQISMPLAKGRWFRSRYVNAQCTIQSAPSGKPEDAHVSSIILNGQPVGEEALDWRYGEVPSLKRHVLHWTTEMNLKTFEITDSKVILETNTSTEDPFTSPSPSPSPSP